MLVNNDQQFIVEWKNNPCQQYVYNSSNLKINNAKKNSFKYFIFLNLL
jgi:hypothetical protein